MVKIKNINWAFIFYWYTVPEMIILTLLQKYIFLSFLLPILMSLSAMAQAQEPGENKKCSYHDLGEKSVYLDLNGQRIILLGWKHITDQEEKMLLRAVSGFNSCESLEASLKNTIGKNQNLFINQKRTYEVLLGYAHLIHG